MMPRTPTKPLVSSLALLLALGAGASGAPAAQTGGSPSAAAGPPAVEGGASSTPTAEPVVVLKAGDVTLRARSVGMLGHALVFSGVAPHRHARGRVLIQRYSTSTRSWVNAASARLGPRGRFRARWVTNLAGRVLVRALSLPSGLARAASAASSPPAQITIYRPSVATYFGAGFYGKQTACGQTLTPRTLGVANRTLPCGTLVEVSYAGHRLTVPVIDRGPYANGASFDLTEATALELEITETVRIGTLIVGRAANNATLGLPPGVGVTEANLTQTGGTAV